MFSRTPLRICIIYNLRTCNQIWLQLGSQLGVSEVQYNTDEIVLETVILIPPEVCPASILKIVSAIAKQFVLF